MKIYVWVQRGNTIGGEAEGNESGRTVVVSANGSIVAVRAYSNNKITEITHVT